MASIKDFFKGQNVFITGASGFMGKTLVEKLLRSCPDLGNVYVLIRAKKGKDPCKRILDITDSSIFSVLKHENADALRKIIPIIGDCAEPGLGLSSSDRKILEENVSIVFHSAASVRFDDSLKYATIINVRCTRDVVLLVRNMKHLKVFVHISTCYCNCDRETVEEIIYPPHADWRKMINMVETIDENTLNIMTQKILNGFPNTYVYTKSLAEHVVRDLSKNLPVVIIRPSVVISTLNDPFPGWVDNFNGPVGLLAGGAKGIVRICYGEPNAALDYMPVDIAIRIILSAAWHKANSRNYLEPEVYHVSSHEIKTVSMSQLLELGVELSEEIPVDNFLWIPGACVLRNRMWYFLNMLVFHLLPALVVDGILKLSGKKPILVNIQKKVFCASIALHYFTSKTWKFKNRKMFQLREQITPSERKDFGIDNIENVVVRNYLKDAMFGARTYLLKEPVEKLPQSRIYYKWMYWLDKFVQTAGIIFALWYMHHTSFIQNTILRTYFFFTN